MTSPDAKPEPAPHQSQFKLLAQRRFGPFFLVQFLGAFNDNLAKNAMIALLAFQGAQFSSLSTGLVSNLAAGLFILPFFCASAFAGRLADKIERSQIIKWVKGLEAGIMLICLAGFHFKSLPLLLFSIALLGLHSTIFGPVKYSILPQQVSRAELVGANALVEAGTFGAILLGTIAGGLFGAMGAGGGEWAAIAGLVLATLGFVAACFVPPAPAPSPELKIGLNLWSQTMQAIAKAKTPKSVWLSILGISWFWLYGATLLSQFPSFAKDTLGGGATGMTLLLAVFSVGVGAGSLLCERLSHGRVEIGLVPLGSIGMTLFGADLFFASPNSPFGAGLSAMELLGFSGSWRVLIDLFGVGLFGGLYIVPLYALVQTRSEEKSRSQVIAANNIMNALFMVISAIVSVAALSLGASVPQIFLGAAIANALVAVYIYSLVPEFLLRFVALALSRVLYRVDESRLTQIPEEGPALLTCNHVSFVDAVVLMGLMRRPIRFVMDHRIFKTPVLSFLFRSVKAIPIASAKEDPEMMERAFDQVSEALRAGEAVLIFPEGRLTSDGEMGPFRPGVTRIIERDPTPVTPLALGGLWGSFFSRAENGKAMSRPFRRGAFNRITLSSAPPLPPEEATPERLREITARMLEEDDARRANR